MSLLHGVSTYLLEWSMSATLVCVVLIGLCIGLRGVVKRDRQHIAALQEQIDVLQNGNKNATGFDAIEYTR